MQDNQTKLVSIPIKNASKTSIKSELNEESISSGSTIFACSSAQICLKCKDLKENRKKEAQNNQQTVNLLSDSTLLACPSIQFCPKCKDFKPLAQNKALDESEQEEEDLRGTESTDTIVAFPQNSQANGPNKYQTVSDVLNNMATEIKSIESIHELKHTKEKQQLLEQDDRQNTALENASDTKRLSYFDEEGFMMYDQKIVTSLTDLDTLKFKSNYEESPRASFTFQEPPMNLIESKRQSWRSIRRTSGSLLSRISNAFRKSNQ